MSTLKSLVDETTNIKNEIVECHSNLKDILVSKDVKEVVEESKISNLIESVNNVKVTTLDTTGSFKDAIFFSDKYSYTSATTLQDHVSYTSKFSGNVRVFVKTFAAVSGYTGRYVIYKNGDTIYDATIAPKDTQAGTAISINTNLNIGDVISVKFCGVNRFVGIHGVAILCDFKFK